MIPPPPRTIRKYCAQSEKTATSPSCKKITQPSGAATPEEADARCKRAHPLPPACCIIPQDLGTKVPLVCSCEPLCGPLRGRVAFLPQRRISSRFRADLSKLSVRRKRSRRKALALFCANAHSQQPAVRAAARVCGFWKLTLFSRFPERFDAKFEKSRRKASCHNGLRRRFDRKSVRFIPL